MAEPTYTALDIAKWFVNATDRESGDAITHLKVQKLIYYAQGWALANLGRPLFQEDMEAWAHGPVAPSVFAHFRDKGFNAIEPQPITRRVVGDDADLLAAVNEKYGVFSAKRLERMTHTESPWLNARGDLRPEARCANPISKADMKSFFEGLGRAAA
ncbi:MAG: type II toxin-antitoxin system antitoxin SocA domain-containing protein [Pseudomonadota bacterium]